MRPLEKITFEAIVSRLRVRFNGLERVEAVGNYNYALSDILMSAVAMFFFQDPSLLAFQERLVKKQERCNLQTMFGVGAVPKDSQMRERLDEVECEGVRVILPELFEQMRRTGWVRDWRTEISEGRNQGFYYLCAFDGSDYYSSEKISCENCVERTNRAGEINYRHAVVGGRLVKAGKKEILPLDAELCRPQDGHQKQDCESEAGKRLLRRIRSEHRNLRLIVTRDDLYSRVSFVQEGEKARVNDVLVAKPDSHRQLFEWVAGLERMKEVDGVCGE
jgi:hypothetical protein